MQIATREWIKVLPNNPEDRFSARDLERSHVAAVVRRGHTAHRSARVALEEVRCDGPCRRLGLERQLAPFYII